MSLRPLVVLDIGSTKIACAIALPNAHACGYELLGTSLTAFLGIAETEWPDVVALGRCIEEAIEATGVAADISRVHVVFSHTQLMGERMSVNVALADEPISIRTKDLTRLEDAAVGQALAVDRETLFVQALGFSGNGFTGVRTPQGLTATRLQGIFQVITMPMAVRRLLTQALESCGYESASLGPSLTASYAGIVDDALRRKRVLVIDAGGLSTAMGLFNDGLLEHFRVAAWGGNTVARSVGTTCRSTLEQAVSWSLEGTASRKPEVSSVIQQEWNALEEPLRALVAGEPVPDAIILCGRAALMDGFVERAERVVGSPAQIGRHERAQRFGELSRQIGLSAALGRMDQLTASPRAARSFSSHPLGRAIARTKSVLAEYF